MRVIDLFCGCGGFSTGFQQAGFDIVLGVDNDPQVLETFRANHPGTHVRQDDVRAVSGRDVVTLFGEIDVVIGSPPCANFSSINPNKDRSDTSLVAEFFRIVDELSPKYWLLENVFETEPYIQGFAPEFRGMILNAADFGVPQKRKRLFFGNHPQPDTTHSEHGNGTLDGRTLDTWRTLGSVLEDDVMWGILSEKVLNRLRKTKARPGYTIPFPDPLDKPARTLLASAHSMNQNVFVIALNGHHRLLTVRELARLQGFPDSYIWVGTYNKAHEVIGNAVPPPVSRAIAAAIYDHQSTDDADPARSAEK